jgi:hypothetical protein
MLLIVTRESRHTKGTLKSSGEWSTCYDFYKYIRGCGSTEAAKRLLEYTKFGNLTIGKYLDYVEYLFFKGKFSGGYGGEPWAMITQCLNNFFKGKLSPELLLDQSYTLAHNNGPMFNKGMFFSHQETNDMYKTLDLQAAGKIPQLVYTYLQSGHKKDVSKSVSDETLEYWKEVNDLYPKDFSGYPDFKSIKPSHNGSYNSLVKYTDEAKINHDTVKSKMLDKASNKSTAKAPKPWEGVSPTSKKLSTYKVHSKLTFQVITEEEADHINELKTKAA